MGPMVNGRFPNMFGLKLIVAFSPSPLAADQLFQNDCPDRALLNR
jgi:hypothetical protein